MSDGAVTLSDGSTLADPHRALDGRGHAAAAGRTGSHLPVEHGRLVVDDHLLLRPNIWAGGDAAAAKDPFNSKGPTIRRPPSTRSAWAWSSARTSPRAWATARRSPYRHHDLGLVADLGGTAAVARPLGIPLTGVVAKLVTKAYHLYAIPAMPNRLRVGLDWVVNAFSRPVAAQLGLVSAVGCPPRRCGAHPAVVFCRCRGGTMPSMTDFAPTQVLTRTQASDAVTDLGWRYLINNLMASIEVPSMAAGSSLSAALVEAVPTPTSTCGSTCARAASTSR